jgi:hypothetical protein
VRVEADINESNTGLFKEVSASKVALYPSLMLPTLPTMPQPAAIRFGPQRPASPADNPPRAWRRSQLTSSTIATAGLVRPRFAEGGSPGAPRTGHVSSRGDR